MKGRKLIAGKWRSTGSESITEDKVNNYNSLFCWNTSKNSVWRCWINQDIVDHERCEKAPNRAVAVLDSSRQNLSLGGSIIRGNGIGKEGSDKSIISDNVGRNIYSVEVGNDDSCKGDVGDVSGCETA
ncbi:hypothetical protein RCL_jg4822.t1 [Rhizophagus clarus]|uniref:Uncharacterized protein n=1 Tax=Rhizophagus clarus TaxID=94130 RepID=A0A8H3MGF9_9GLOM|nr:hypothetical protein RCL_jg4822.t1 [Rhizophagus clarus]